jgi:hypothetical protein
MFLVKVTEFKTDTKHYAAASAHWPFIFLIFLYSVTLTRNIRAP